MTPDPSVAAASFRELGLREELLTALSGLGYEEATPIQEEAIPPLLAGRDLIGQAATGTGKTAAFALPLLHGMSEGRGRGLRGLVLVPTRELAMQVSEAIHRYGRGLDARVLPIYGGQPIQRQLRALKAGVDVVVATPGRALDHLRRGTLALSNIPVVVLDEADEMLDMGFADDIEQILAATSDGRQTILFSATMPARIDQLARRYLRDPVRIELGRQAPAEGETSQLRQAAYVVQRAHKMAALGRVLDMEAPSAALIFCRTRNEVDQVTETLNARGYRCQAMHGGMSQEERERVLGRLRAGTADLLVATDVAARGLDIDLLSHVINYDLPSSPDYFVHRIGRVGRAGRAGVAITLVEPREHHMLKNLERVSKRPIPVERLPTVADLHARRLEMTRAALCETLMEDDLDRFRVVVESLAEEFDVLDIASAAVKLAHEASGVEEASDEIPEAPRSRERDGPKRQPKPGPGRRSPGTARIFIGAGREAGIRPQDLVGAIAGESQLDARDIGSIEIADRFSLVEVPEAEMAHVIDSLKGTHIRGHRPVIRPERGGKG